MTAFRLVPRPASGLTRRLTALTLVLAATAVASSVFAAPLLCRNAFRAADLDPAAIVALLGVDARILEFRRPREEIPPLTIDLLKARILELPEQAGLVGEPSYKGFLGEIGVRALVAGVLDRAGPGSASIASEASYNEMAASDAKYGPAPRYVALERLDQMLAFHRQEIVDTYRNVDMAPGRDRRAPRVGTRFFAYANTAQVGANGHAWLGTACQTSAGGAYNTVKLHVALKGGNNYAHRRALAKLGINVIYACYRYAEDPARFIESLGDGIASDELEIDAIATDGPDFAALRSPSAGQRALASGLASFVATSPGGAPFLPSGMSYQRELVYDFRSLEDSGPPPAPDAATTWVRVVRVAATSATESEAHETVEAAHARGEVALLALSDAAPMSELLSLAARGAALTAPLRTLLGSPRHVTVIDAEGHRTTLANP